MRVGAGEPDYFKTLQRGRGEEISLLCSYIYPICADCLSYLPRRSDYHREVEEFLRRTADRPRERWISNVEHFLNGPSGPKQPNHEKI